MKSVAVIENKPIFLEGLRSIILNSGFNLAFCARRLDNITAADLGSAPDLILVSCEGRDVGSRLPELQSVRERLPATKLVLIVDTITADDTLQVWPLVDGFILLTIDAQALAKALEVVLLGERVMPGIARDIAVNGLSHPPSASPTNPLHLSAREQDVLRSLSGGCSNKVIARSMGLSESTVKVHVRGILRKLKARNRTEAAVWARTHGIVPDSRPPNGG
jgi:two-component system nitrate/nitrite response regulator NarL